MGGVRRVATVLERRALRRVRCLPHRAGEIRGAQSAGAGAGARGSARDSTICVRRAMCVQRAMCVVQCAICVVQCAELCASKGFCIYYSVVYRRSPGLAAHCAFGVSGGVPCAGAGAQRGARSGRGAPTRAAVSGAGRAQGEQRAPGNRGRAGSVSAVRGLDTACQAQRSCTFAIVQLCVSRCYPLRAWALANGRGRCNCTVLFANCTALRKLRCAHFASTP